MKKKPATSLYKSRLMLAVACLLTASVLVGCGFYTLFGGALEEQITQLGDYAVSSAVGQEERIRNECREVFDQITFDNELAALMYYAQPSAAELLSGIKRLDSYRNSSAVIDSIYLYNVQSETFYVSSSNSTQAVQRKGDMYDTQAAEIISRYWEYDNMQPIARRLNVSYPKMATLGLVSYLRYNALSQGRATCILMINTKQEVYLTGLWRGVHSEEFHIDLIDKQGISQITLDDVSLGDDLSHHSYISHVVSENGKRGYFRDMIDGQSCFVFYDASFSDYWSLCYSISQNYINSLLGTRSKFSWLVVLIVLLAVFVSMAGMLIYKVIQFQAQQQAALEDAQEQQRNRAYQEQVSRLRRLLNESAQIEPAEYKALMTSCGLTDDAASYLLILFHQDNYQEYRSTMDMKRMALTNFSLCALTMEIAQFHRPQFCVDIPGGSLVLVVRHDDGEQLAHDVIDQIQSMMGLAYSALIAAPIASMRQLSDAYRWCDENLPYLQMNNRGCVLGWETVRDAEQTTVTYPDTLVRQMISNVMRLDMQKAGVDLHEILNQITAASYKSFHVALMQFLVTLDENLTLLVCNNAASIDAYSSIALFTAASMENVQDIETAICNQLNEVETVVISRKDEKYADLIRQVEQIIDSGACSASFGLNEIADATSYSATYLGRLYRKYTGMTLTERILKARMTRALDLLTQTELSINQIAEQSGFSDATYFYKTFKKYNGTTPAAWRQGRRR